MRVGGRGILFRSIWGNGGEGEQGYVPERLWEVRSLAGEVLPHQAASCGRTLEVFELLSGSDIFSWEAADGALALNISLSPRTISVVTQNLRDKGACWMLFRKLEFPLQYCHLTGETATPTMQALKL